MRKSRFLVLALLGTPALAPAPAFAAAPLIAHRAVYDLALDKASDRSGIIGLQGRMVYEFNGSPCEGYTVNFRFVTQVDTGETSRLTDQQTTTFEDAGGKSFSFVTKSFTDQALERELKGTAMREPNGLKVEIDKPEKNSLELRQDAVSDPASGRTDRQSEHRRVTFTRRTCSTARRTATR